MIIIKNNNIKKVINTKYAKFLNFIFPKNSIRFVGGCVRDALLSKQITDYDLATTLTPDEMKSLFQEYSVSLLDYGIDHGTVVILVEDKVIEITTLRKDIETDGRHAKVEFTNSWQEDASRRDFTINAMYIDMNGEVYDYYNGINDLYSGNIKFIGDPSMRIQEDYLRIMRFFRFISRFGSNKKDHKEEIEIIKNNLNGLKKISKERIRNEIIKTFNNTYSIKAISLMHESGTLQTIIPTWNENIYGKCIAFNGKLNNQLSFISLLGLIDIMNIDNISNLKSYFILSRSEVSDLKFINKFFKNQLTYVDIFINKKEYLIKDIKSIATMMQINISIPINAYIIKNPEVSYQDIIDHNITGNNISITYKDILHKTIENPKKWTKINCLNYIKSLNH